MISRRSLVATFAGSIVAVPLCTSAQQAAKVFRIGVLGIRQPSAQELASDPFAEELRRRGYVEGGNLVIEGRFSGGDVGRLEGLAKELVASNVDVIVTFGGTPGVLAAKKATTTIPIVMMTSADPVDSGIVASLAHPGGNITGNAIFGLELAVKRLEILAEVVGKPTRIAYLVHRRTRSSLPHMEAFIATVADAANSRGAKFQVVEVESSDDLEPAFELMVRQHVGAVLIDNFGFFLQNMVRIAALTDKYRLPAIAEGRGYSEAGLLVTYGVDYADLMRKTVVYVDKILKGAKPSDLPVEQASRFELIINRKTAKALGVTIPQSLLLRAGEVIE